MGRRSNQPGLHRTAKRLHRDYGAQRFEAGHGTRALAAAAVGVKGPANGFHQDAIRIPMMILAVVGSVINLYMIWRIRSLRERASSQWRRQPVSPRRLWGERVQLTLAVVTLVLVLAEFLSHHYVYRLVG